MKQASNGTNTHNLQTSRPLKQTFSLSLFCLSYKTLGQSPSQEDRKWQRHGPEGLGLPEPSAQGEGRATALVTS